jgi:nitrate reductase gamma subunit
MHTGTVILVSLIAALLVGFGTCYVVVMISQYCFPPVVEVNGVVHPVMPIGSLLHGLVGGVIAAIGSFVFAYRRLNKL